MRTLTKLTGNLILIAALFAFLATYTFGGLPTAAKGDIQDLTGVVAATAPMTSPRSVHTATLLPGGQVLVVGGMLREGTMLDSAELFDPATNTFSPVAPMNVPRAGHTATLLDDGRVLIAGGWGPSLLPSAEVYDPTTGVFTLVGEMAFPRGGAAATLLLSGQVLITGGTDVGQKAAAELFDPASGTFATTGALNEERAGHTATRLRDGRVLVAGGQAVGEDRVLRSAELYDPHFGLFSPANSLMLPRRTHGAALLPDGLVMIIGGSDGRDWNGRHISSELFDPVRGEFVPGPSLDAPRFKIGGAVATLGNGQPFIAGDGSHAALYSLVDQRFYIARGSIEGRYLFMTATALHDGRVLIAGGYDPTIRSTAQAWLFTPDRVDE